MISTRRRAGAIAARPRSRTRRRSPRRGTGTCPSPGPSGAARHLSQTCRRSPGRAWRRPWVPAPSGPHFYTSLCAKSSCARRPTPPRRRVCVGRVCVGPAPPPRRRRRDPVCVRVTPTPSSPRRRSCESIQVTDAAPIPHCVTSGAALRFLVVAGLRAAGFLGPSPFLDDGLRPGFGKSVCFEALPPVILLRMADAALRSPLFSVEEVALSKHQPRTCSVFGSFRCIASYNKVTGTQCGGYLNLCGNQILRRVRPESPRRPPRHRRDASSMAWRCRFLTARPSQHGRVIAEK